MSVAERDQAPVVPSRASLPLFAILISMSDITSLEKRMEARFDDLTSLLSQFANDVDAKFKQQDTRFDAIEGRFDKIEGRLDVIEDRLDGLDKNTTIWSVLSMVLSRESMITKLNLPPGTTKSSA